MATSVSGLSKGQIDRAGARLRLLLTDPKVWHDLNEDVIAETFATLIGFRSSFQTPLTKVVMGLRSMVKSEMALPPPDGKLPVGQRMKREPQIGRKLLRYPDMKLSRMQDIAGCRAIPLGGKPEVDGVLRRIRRNWGTTIKGFKDYVNEPAPTGYRAIHVVVLRDGHLVEIQLRTPGQHEWAEAVERTGLRTRLNLKEGEGPDDLLRYFSLAAEGIALEEAGETPDEGFTQEFQALREQVRHYFSSGGVA